MRRQNERGAVTVPLMLACIILTLSGLGTWGVLRHWRFVAETQVRLDRCTREAALELKATQQLIERTNAGIHAARLLILVNMPDPPALAAARTALAVLVLRQDAALLAWKGRRVAWLLPTHCGDPGDLRLPLPELDWTRPPPDPVGPQPLA